MNNILSNIYYDTSNPAGFSGVHNLINSVKNKYKTKEIQKWISSQDAYTLHRPARKHFIRNKYKVSNINDIFQADLCDMRKLSRFNDGYKYILTVIDVFSRYAWAFPLSDKKPKSVIQAFKTLFKERKPIFLQTDKGSEFIAKSVRSFLKENDVKYYVTHNSDVKACFVERFNRTLKTKMYRYFTYKNAYRYIDILQNLVTAYNNTKHRSIKIAPCEVNENNILKVWMNQNKIEKNITKKRGKYKIGDIVRISKYKTQFEKGYESNWSEELFKIYAISNRIPIVYKLKDLNNEIIEGTFYENELQRVYIGSDTTYKIDKIVDTKGTGNRKKLLVKWRGYSDKFNSWIPANTIRLLNDE